MTFEFTGTVIEWRGPSPYFFVVVPPDVSAEIAEVAASVTYGWGAIPVEATVGRIDFTTSLFPQQGRYLLPLRDAVRRPLAIGPGSEVPVRMALRSP